MEPGELLQETCKRQTPAWPFNECFDIKTVDINPYWCWDTNYLVKKMNHFFVRRKFVWLVPKKSWQFTGKSAWNRRFTRQYAMLNLLLPCLVNLCFSFHCLVTQRRLAHFYRNLPMNFANKRKEYAVYYSRCSWGKKITWGAQSVCVAGYSLGKKVNISLRLYLPADWNSEYHLHNNSLSLSLKVLIWPLEPHRPTYSPLPQKMEMWLWNHHPLPRVFYYLLVIVWKQKF